METCEIEWIKLDTDATQEVKNGYYYSLIPEKNNKGEVLNETI